VYKLNQFNKMKNKQKGFVVPLLIIIAVLVIGGGLYFYTKSQSAENSAPSTLTPQTVSDLNQTSGQDVTNTSGSQTVKGPNTAKVDDSAIAKDIKQIAIMAEQFYSNHNLTYVGFCLDTSNGVNLIWNDLTSKNVGGKAGINCKATASGYVISSTLNSGAYACANSAVSVQTNLVAFPTGMDCSGPTIKTSTTPASTPTPVSGSSATSVSIPFNAKVIGGTLSKTDSDAIIAGTMNMVSALNSGNPTLFRKYAAIITPPDQMDALNKMTDQQLLTIMNTMGKTATKDISPASLSSADATWSIIDSNNVEIKIQLAPVGAANVSETVQAMKINGVWY
jgi:hypothetical protein